MKKLLLLILFASVAFGQSVPLPPDVDSAIAGTVNFEGTVTSGVTDLVSSVAPSIMPFGWTILAFFGIYALLQTLVQGTLRSMSSHHYNPLATTVAYVAVLFRISIATLMMTFYMVPLPGLPFNFHQMFPYLAQALTNAVTTDLLKQVLTDFNNAIHYLPPVGMFQVLPALLTILVLGLIALGQVAMTIITAGSYAIVGMLTLCGPLIIPYYVLPVTTRSFGPGSTTCWPTLCTSSLELGSFSSSVIRILIFFEFARLYGGPVAGERALSDADHRCVSVDDVQGSGDYSHHLRWRWWCGFGFRQCASIIGGSRHRERASLEAIHVRTNHYNPNG